MTIKNRFVRSATWAGMAGDDGSCTPKLVELIVKLAEGGVDLIITGHAYVSKRGQVKKPNHGCENSSEEKFYLSQAQQNTKQ
ncbi:MAG: hypothetical protein U9N47_05935, partial [Thermodesulfobacteriota bacterium]|nr:hypothetical protein [Thermodesulfobacteriota bacterium]